MVAASPNTPWAMIDSTLWNMAFTGQAKAQWYLMVSHVCISWNHIITLGQGTLLAKIALLGALLCSFQFIQLTVTY